MEQAAHQPLEVLEAGLPHVLMSPREAGTLEMIVRRPGVEEREVVQEAELSLEEGLVGDNWGQRGSPSMPDHSSDPERQLTLINSRLIDMLAGSRALAALAGDQLHLDLDLSDDNLPPGTRLRIGGAVIEVTQPPHTGCKKFSTRFGLEALKFISEPSRKGLHLRGLNAKVVQPGTIRAGDAVHKLP